MDQHTPNFISTEHGGRKDGQRNIESKNYKI